MTHTDAIAASPIGFATRNGMIFGGDEQFRLQGDRFFRLLINNAQCFEDWEPVMDPAKLDMARKHYPYLPDKLPVVEGQAPVQGQKRVHGKKIK